MNVNDDQPTKSSTTTEEVVDEVIDLEEYSTRGEKPPRARGYRVKVNGQFCEFQTSTPTGREILIAAGLVEERYTLRVKEPGQKLRKVALDERVDFCALFIEKFKALPQDQTEGEQ